MCLLFVKKLRRNIMKRFVAVLFAVAMIISVCLFAASCDSAKPAETTTSKTSETVNTDTDVTTATETTAAQTETENNESGSTTQATPGTDDKYENWDGKSKLPGKENVDFGGKTFLIAARTDEVSGGWNNGREIWVEALTNDAVNDAVFERNQIMSKLYNCTIMVDNGGWANGINADIAAGGGKYIAGCAAYSNGASGQFYNVLNFDIDYSQSWWDQAFFRDLECNGKLYMLCGDFAMIAMRAAWIMFYNKTIYDQNLADEYDIYQLVRDKKWTIDVLLTMCQKVLSDNDGDQQYTYTTGADADVLGLMTTTHNYRALYYSCGERYVDKDENGKMVNALTKTGRASDVIDVIRTLTTDESYLEIGYSYVHRAMMNGTTLFAGEVLGTLEVVTAQEGLRLGIVPQPLLSEGHGEYVHYVNNQAPFYLIPTSYPDMQEIADFFTLFAAHSQKIVRSAFVNTYKYTYASDEESAEMVDLILNTRIYDPGYLFNFASGFDSMITGGTLLGRTGSNVFSSAAKRYSNQINESISNYESRIAAIDDPV